MALIFAWMYGPCFLQDSMRMLLNYLDKVLQFGSDDEIDMFVLRGVARAFLGREDEAMEDFQKASSIDSVESYEFFARWLEGTRAVGHRSEEEIIHIHQKFAESIWKESA